MGAGTLYPASLRASRIIRDPPPFLAPARPGTGAGGRSAVPVSDPNERPVNALATPPDLIAQQCRGQSLGTDLTAQGGAGQSTDPCLPALDPQARWSKPQARDSSFLETAHIPRPQGPFPPAYGSRGSESCALEAGAAARVDRPGGAEGFQPAPASDGADQGRGKGRESLKAPQCSC